MCLAYQSGSTSKYLEQLDNLSENKINHMIDGSKNSNHGWEKLVPDKNWSDIKNIIADAMDTGVEGPYKSVLSKKSPEFRILKIKRSPSSPYFPVKVDRFSKLGVSKG